MTIPARLHCIAWHEAEESLTEQGYARLGPLLTHAECDQLIASYAFPDLFRSRIDMHRYRFGSGDYQYFANPLPPLVEDLRTHAYPPLAAIANHWMEALGKDDRFPEEFAGMAERCAAAGQHRPTPLLLHYEKGGYNCLHQDLYGDVAFPLQLLVFLSQPGIGYEGGEFLLVEQRMQAQSVGRVITANKGEAIIFPNRHRPIKSKRGHYRANVRHGVSEVTAGTRWTLGIPFHDAT